MPDDEPIYMEIRNGVSIPVSNSPGVNRAPVASRNDRLPRLCAQPPPDYDYVPYVPQQDDSDGYVTIVHQTDEEPIYGTIGSRRPYLPPPASRRIETPASGKPAVATPGATPVESAESVRTGKHEATEQARVNREVRERSVEEKRGEARLLDAFDAADGAEKFGGSVPDCGGGTGPVPSPASLPSGGQGIEANHDEVGHPEQAPEIWARPGTVEEERREAYLLDAFDAADGDAEKFGGSVREPIAEAARHGPVPSPASLPSGGQGIAAAEANHDEVGHPEQARSNPETWARPVRTVEEERREAYLLDAFDAADGDAEKFGGSVRELIAEAARHGPVPAPASLMSGGQGIAAAEANHDEVGRPEQGSLPPTSHAVETQASRALALDTLQAVGVANPESELVRIYRQHAPAETRLDLEVRRREEAMQQEAYLRSAFRSSDGDRNRFSDLIQEGKTEVSRLHWGGQTYRRLCEQIEPFPRPTPEEYLRSFDDLPADVHARVHKGAIEFALDHAFGIVPE